MWVDKKPQESQQVIRVGHTTDELQDTDWSERTREIQVLCVPVW